MAQNEFAADINRLALCQNNKTGKSGHTCLLIKSILIRPNHEIDSQIDRNFCPKEEFLLKKKAAKWSRQHAGKKYREFAQRRVCFVNEQVP